MTLSEPRYDVLTWDVDAQEFTEQVGMSNPSLNVPWQGLLRALRELRTLGYSCHRLKHCGESDPSVLVKRAAMDSASMP